MDFIEKLRNLSSRIEAHKHLVQTEEATKIAFVQPFIEILEYKVSDPAEVVPEFDPKVGDLKGEKVDYAIFKGDQQVVMIIECKKYGEDLSKDAHRQQLARYFPHVDAQFAVLTDGVLYKFYTHLKKDNIMDTKPFLEFNMLDIQEPWVNELKRFTKSKFDPSIVIDIARDLQYKKEIKEFMEKQLQTPSEDFVRFLLSFIYDGNVTKLVVERFTSIIKEALHEFLEGRIQQRLQAAATREEEPAEPPDEDEFLDEQQAQPKKKGQNTRLIVTFPNNEVIFHLRASETFPNVIKRLGIESVKNVMPELFSDTKSEKYTKVGSYYVNLQTNTQRKKDQLDEIAYRLNIKLTVEITKDKP